MVNAACAKPMTDEAQSGDGSVASGTKVISSRRWLLLPLDYQHQRPEGGSKGVLGFVVFQRQRWYKQPLM
jgi:hypothetical protein